MALRSVCLIPALLYGVDNKESSNLIAHEYDQVQVPAHMVFKSGADVLENVQCIDVLRNMCTVLDTDVT